MGSMEQVGVRRNGLCPSVLTINLGKDDGTEWSVAGLSVGSLLNTRWPRALASCKIEDAFACTHTHCMYLTYWIAIVALVTSSTTP